MVGYTARMLPSTYETQDCSIARTLEVVGERWTLLILRDAFRGVRRFDDFADGLGIARNVLARRLDSLCEAGILERRRYQDRPERSEYRLTQRGRDLWPVLTALRGWGDRHVAPQGPPVRIEHVSCGGMLDVHVHCDRCGDEVALRDARYVEAAAPAR